MIQLKNEIALDIETNGLDPYSNKLLLLQINDGTNIHVIDCQTTDIKPIIQEIKDSNVLVIGHNIKFDLKFIYHNTGILLTNVYDTMIAEALIYRGVNNRFNSLKFLIEKYTGIVISKDVRKQFIGAESIELTDEILEYAQEDVKHLFTIKAKQMDAIENAVNQSKILDLELKLVPVIAKMEYDGIYFDTVYFRSIEKVIKEDYEKKRLELLDLIISRIKKKYKHEPIEEMFETLKIPDKIIIRPEPGSKEFFEYLYNSINVNSPSQMKRIFQYVGIKVDSTNQKVVNKVNDELAKKLIEYRESAKLVSSFTDSLVKFVNPITGRIHTEFDQLGARTGRFSSSNPNLQQIVSEESYRKSFAATEHKKLICADFSQQELRILAAVSQEDKLINAYKENVDIHALTASLLFHKPISEVTKEERSRGKSMNFAVVYGSSEYGIMHNFSIPLDEARTLLNNFWKGYPTLKSFIDIISDKVVKLGYSITMYGRKRYFEIPKIFNGDFDFMQTMGHIKRAGVNHVIQGTGADIIKLSLIRLFYENPFGDKFKILLTVHDEIVCEVSEDIAEEAAEFVKNIMLECEQRFLEDIPAAVEVKVADYWAK